MNRLDATPLWLAASAGHTDCFSILLDAGAHAGVMSGGKTALQAASGNGHAPIKELLEALPLERLTLTGDGDASESDAHAENGSAGAPSAGCGGCEDDPGLMQFTRTGVAGSSGSGLAPRGRADASDDEPLEGVAPEDQGGDSDGEMERPQLSIN